VSARWLVSQTADGSIVSNVIDMSAYIRALLGVGRTLVDGHDVALLSPEGFRLLTTPVIQDGDHPSHSYAYGLRIGGDDGVKEIAHSGGMVGYTALMVVRPEQGIGCMLMLNGDGVSEEIARFALDSVDAALRGVDAPAISHPAAPTVVAHAADYIGSYEGHDRKFEIVATADGLMLRQGPIGAPLVPVQGDSFLVEHAALDRYLLSFGRDSDGRVVEAFHGDDWLRGKDHADTAPPDYPQEWRSYPGIYRSNNPWAPVLRIMLRKGELAIWWSGTTEEERLSPLEDGSFAVGESWRPMRIRFLGMDGSRAAVAEFNGARWYRAVE
jgi:hypothetical protein